MRFLFFICFVSLLFLKCSPSPSGKGHTPGTIADAVKLDGTAVSVCTGKECCSEHKSCTRICDQIFYNSGDKIRKQCRFLPQNIVTGLKELVLVLRSPILDDLERLDLSQEFRLLLALDYRAWIRIIKAYNINEARALLVWLAKNQEPVDELLQLKVEIRNEILYEALASAGDRTLAGPVEEGLFKKISFDKSFFQYMISEHNYDLLQITHKMIKDDLCDVHYAGDGQTELCILRIYCKERPKLDDQYVHSEDLRNEMARNINDEQFFNYVEKEVLHAGLGTRSFYTGPVMNNQVCLSVCNDNNRGCE